MYLKRGLGIALGKRGLGVASPHLTELKDQIENSAPSAVPTPSLHSWLRKALLSLIAQSQNLSDIEAVI